MVQQSLNTRILEVLRHQSTPTDAYVVSKLVGATAMATGQALHELERQGQVRSDDDAGTANDLARQFSFVMH